MRREKIYESSLRNVLLGGGIGAFVTDASRKAKEQMGSNEGGG